MCWGLFCSVVVNSLCRLTLQHISTPGMLVLLTAGFVIFPATCLGKRHGEVYTGIVLCMCVACADSVGRGGTGKLHGTLTTYIRTYVVGLAYFITFTSCERLQRVIFLYLP